MSCPLKNCQTHICYKKHVFFAAVLISSLLIWLFHFNQPLFYIINSWHVFLPVTLWNEINHIADSKTFILPMVLLFATLIWRRDRFLRVVILIILYYIVFAVLKIAVHESRPYAILAQDSFFWLNQFEDTVKIAQRSFPSGHAGNAAIFVFTLNSLFFKNHKVIKILLCLFLILVCLARVCTGWHWPLDVLSSSLIAYVLVNLCLWQNRCAKLIINS